jgi:DnaJ-class molecular chaperone
MYELYNILKINYPSNNKEIKQSYRKLAKKYHPDKYKLKDNGEMFKKIKNAYSILSDEEMKNNYDKKQKQLEYDIYIKAAKNLFQISIINFLKNINKSN